MESVNVTSARKDIYALVDRVNLQHKPLQIVGKRGNAVLLSEADWNALEETLYLSGVPGLVEKILAADEENISAMPTAEDLEW